MGRTFKPMNPGLGYPYETGRIQLSSGPEVNYIDEGEGTATLLFIHGLANYALVWRKNIDTLRGHYRCIAIDLPGNGLSGKGNYPYSMAYFADTIGEVILKLGLSNVVLVGHSMGGQVALTLALKQPELVRMLVLCAPAGFEYFSPMEATLYKTTLQLTDFFSTDENSLTRLIRSSFYQNTHQGDSIIGDLISVMHMGSQREYRNMVDTCIQGMLHEPVYHSLHLITCPTLIIFGDRDALIPNRMLHPVSTRSVAEAAAARMPAAELHILPRCGHFVQWEKAAEVNSLIGSFVAARLKS